MIKEELDILNKLLEEKQNDIKWTKKRLKEQSLELEMIENRIILTKQVMAEESEVK